MRGILVYSTLYRPDPHHAIDVLAFLLTPAAAFADDETDVDEVECYLGRVKREALLNWYAAWRREQ